ncbi:MAG: hypothetical protein EP330_12535 [Deltaproteobacteria bacterium]|nr:MAG: hypothetical protein EP330_12535 [Deltaproteobacteria bacterium]
MLTPLLIALALAAPESSDEPVEPASTATDDTPEDLPTDTSAAEAPAQEVSEVQAQDAGPGPDAPPGPEVAPAPAPAEASPAAQEEAPPAEPAKPKTTFDLGGVYTVWGLTQRNFMLGTDHPLDDAGYTVQMLRLDGKASREAYGVRARLDLAQGWWGVDNDPNIATQVGVDGDGNPVGTTGYNTDAMFGNKGTMYALHVDLAYGWFKLPTAMPIEVRLGRQYYGLGHKIVLDMDYDGIQVEAKPTDDLSIQAWWAKVGEGRGARTIPRGLVMGDNGEFADADLFALVLGAKLGDHALGAYGAYYRDGSAQPDWTLIPNDLGYFRSRHTPNVSSAIVAGLTADGRFDVAEGLAYAVEGVVLTGRDDVDNADYAGGLLDINDGSLFGYNAYATLDQSLDAGVPVTVGVLFGMGSGDADKSGGRGNLQRLQTMGFFPLTYVWEDSVMPDIAGITPQGLGSPVSRGYRELENTTAVQARADITPAKGLVVGGSYTYLLATTPVQAFDASGAPVGAGASDLGQEVDVKLSYALSTKWGPGPTFSALWGVFLPGDAAGNLILGNADDLQPAWELKTVAAMKF